MRRTLITNNFKTNVRDWVAFDSKIKKANNAIKRVKEEKNKIEKGIVKYMKQNKIDNQELKCQNYRLKYKTYKKITPITRKYIKEILLQEEDIDEKEAKEIVKFLYNQKNRLEIMLESYFDNESKATKIVNNIFNNRQRTVQEKICGKINRETMTISSGPISSSAQNTLITPDSTEAEFTD